MTNYDQALMKKRAEELKSQGQTQTQIGNTLNIEKNLGYFSGKTAQTTPVASTPKAPKPQQPTNISTTPPAPAPKLSWVDQLKKQNAHIIAQQGKTPTAPAPVNPTPNITNTNPGYQGTKPTTQPMDAGSLGMQEIQRQGQVQQDQIMKQYQDDIATIRLEEDQAKAQYKNADQVLAGIRAVEDAYKRGIFDPQQIASQTGISLDQVNQVLRGEAFKALELQDRATEEDRRDLDYKMSQLQTSKNRNVDDLATQAERSKYNYDNQVDDMLRQAGLAEAQMNKIGALTGAVKSSGYRMAMDMVRNEAKRGLDRLKTVQGREQDDIAKARTRLLQDFEDNTVQIKDYFDRGMNTLRMNGMGQLQQINQKYGVASQNTVNAMKQLYNDMEAQKVALLNETMQLQQSFNSMRTQEIGILEQRAMGNKNQDIQTYLDLYQTNPALANSMFPELANQVNNANFENFDLSMDFSSMPEIIEQYKGEARAKNNNPGGIKTASPALQQAWRDAGIQFTTGTKPPPGENQANPYTKFATIGDGIKAQWIALSRQGGDINKRLQAWVGTAEGPSYATQVMSRAGIPQGTTFQQLSAEQQQALQTAIIRKESPGLYKIMTGSAGADGITTSTSYDPNRAPEYNNFLQKGKTPVGMKAGTPEYKQFVAESGAYKAEIDQEMKPHAQNLANMIKELETISYSDFNAMRLNLIGEGKNLRSKYERILSSTALQELINLKGQGATFGALSNQELEFITNASSNLRLRGTYDNFVKDLKTMRGSLEKGAGGTATGGQGLDQQQRSPTASGFKINPNM